MFTFSRGGTEHQSLSHHERRITRIGRNARRMGRDELVGLVPWEPYGGISSSYIGRRDEDIAIV
jgi:hypothetical protein